MRTGWRLFGGLRGGRAAKAALSWVELRVCLGGGAGAAIEVIMGGGASVKAEVEACGPLCCGGGIEDSQVLKSTG